MNLEECNIQCTKNCSCTAYANLDIRDGGSGCLLWFGDLIDIKHSTGRGQSIYVRMAGTELDQTHSSSTNKSSSKKKMWIAVISAFVVVVVTVGIALVLLLGRKKRQKKKGNSCSKNHIFGLVAHGIYIHNTLGFAGSMQGLSGSSNKYKDQKDDLELPLFDFATIARATNNFSPMNKIGEGGFGSVYKGILEDGQEIAVKRLSKSSTQGDNEFKNEVDQIAKVQHRNLVKLLGCCIETDEKALIYEFMPNKSLDFFIFAVLIVGLSLVLYLWRKRYHEKPGLLTYVPESSSNVKNQNEDLELPSFDLAAIVFATDNFSMKNKLGEGGFGAVYKGILKDGLEIAVKRLSKSSGQGLDEFKNEVIHIAKLKHRNLVELLGCCIQGDEKMLIYEFMPNKSLDFLIFDQTESFKSNEKGKMRTAVISMVPIAALILGLALILYLWRKARVKKPGLLASVPESSSNGKTHKEDLELPLFDLATISCATNNFSTTNKLGEGGFGPVYKGIMKDGQEIAVKRLSKSSRQGLDEFKNEVIHIAKLQHRNLVKLLGCCIQGDEKMLIYEFMPNKSLDFFIFGMPFSSMGNVVQLLSLSAFAFQRFYIKTSMSNEMALIFAKNSTDQSKSMSLDWHMRYHVINGIARGLLYLHQDSRQRIIHRDLKASNVLLDNEMNPKISDFGLARSFGEKETAANTKKVVGTYGYMAPEYAIDGLYSIKSDVFSFGVLVLEIVSGKRNRGFCHPDHQLNLLGHHVIAPTTLSCQSERINANGKEGMRIAVISVLSAAILILGLALLLYSWRKTSHMKPGSLTVVRESNSNIKNHMEDLEFPSFNFARIACATDNFSTNNKLGEGGFGSVYKGILEDGQEIAVKRLSKASRQGLDEFKNEVIHIAKLKHRNLVNLLGCCIEEDEKLLIYEFMTNKSLDFFIFGMCFSNLKI
ncbi:Serine-threonine/tyrosine-protein kinase [Theobroma cacao]|nr:Serine-threonine/tyrosine-protein kinase [Theobroma cacao]